MADDTFLGIDLGTTNVKAQVVGAGGKILSSGSMPVGITYEADGLAEQDIEDIWTATVSAVRAAVADAGAGSVRAVGISSQGGAIQILDGAGNAAGRVIGWQDSRGGPWNTRVTEKLGADWFVRHIGYSAAGSSIGQLLRLREIGALPAVFRLSWVGDIIVGRLCGRRAQEATSLSESCLCNPRTRREDDDVLALIGVERSQLPDLLPADEPAGGLLPDVARILGLPPGIPVGPAVHDQYASAIGCGAVRAGDTMLGLGTTWVLLAVTDHCEAPVAGVSLVGPHPVPGLFGHMLSMVNGGACLSWAARTFNLGSPGPSDMDSLLLSVPPGSAGLRFRPLLSEVGGGGLPKELAGQIDGLRLGHTPVHILRAVVEGLACELGRYLRMMRSGGVGVERLILCGKAASSSVTPQIIADTVGIPADCTLLPETSSLGAAVLARKLVERGSGLAELADVMKPGIRRVMPSGLDAGAGARLEDYIAGLAGAALSIDRRT
jgi:xylulokinase